jgi:hypothetical protein
MEDSRGLRLREKGVNAVSILLVSFVLYTCATGPFEGIIHRAVFIAILVVLGVFMFPLWSGSRLRPLGILVDAGMTSVTLFACGYVIANYELIMGSLGNLPMATTQDIVLTVCLVVVILEISRRAIGLIFPSIVLVILLYALFGEYVPGRLGHRGFDIYFLTETLLLSDLGIWGMLTGVAATIIAAFTVFGSVLMNTGGGRTFIDIAMRLGGRAPGGGGEDRDDRLGSLRHGQRQRRCQRGYDRKLHHSSDEETGIPIRDGRGNGSHRLDGRPARAADHGCGGLHHGGDHRGGLRPHHDRRRASGIPVLHGGVHDDPCSGYGGQSRQRSR